MMWRTTIIKLPCLCPVVTREATTSLEAAQKAARAINALYYVTKADFELDWHDMFDDCTYDIHDHKGRLMGQVMCEARR